MAESRQQKARRLVTEFFNDHLQSLNLGKAEVKDVGILLTYTREDKKGWTMVLLMKSPLIMYYEVTWSKTGKFSVVMPFMPYTHFYYPDQPAPAAVKFKAAI